MNSWSDSETETEYVEEERTTNVKDIHFRETLTTWKKKQLEDILKENQNTLALNSYLQKTAEIYDSLKNYIEGRTKEIPVEKALVEDLGNPLSFDLDTRIRLLHTLFRDLIEFPFTYDTKLINSFTKEDILNTNILPNQ